MTAELILKLANLDKETVYAIADYIFELNKKSDTDDRASQARTELRINLLRLIGDEDLPF